MKVITLKDEKTGDKYQVNIVYSIFDITNPLLEDNFEVASANNAQQALKIYNKAKNRTNKYKRTDGCGTFGNATVCVSTLFYDKYGTRYKYGRRTWFEVIEN